MGWLRRLIAGYTQDYNGGRPCCGEFATCRRACVPRGEWRRGQSAERAIDALHTLYLETADYIERNKLGPVHHNGSMQAARDALVAEGRTIWYEGHQQGGDSNQGENHGT